MSTQGSLIENKELNGDKSGFSISNTEESQPQNPIDDVYDEEVFNNKNYILHSLKPQ